MKGNIDMSWPCALLLTLVHMAPTLYLLWWDAFKRPPSEFDGLL